MRDLSHYTNILHNLDYLVANVSMEKEFPFKNYYSKMNHSAEVLRILLKNLNFYYMQFNFL
jgi:hypothetical protein